MFGIDKLKESDCRHFCVGPMWVLALIANCFGHEGNRFLFFVLLVVYAFFRKSRAIVRSRHGVEEPGCISDPGWGEKFKEMHTMLIVDGASKALWPKMLAGSA
ncbi:MAG: hypothetical protein QM786_03605 [Breznakibacter sp.]